jgi:circadian clock protein KaiC
MGELSHQLALLGCTAILVGEYTLPQDLGGPEFAVCDCILSQEIRQTLRGDVRLMRVYKARGGSFIPGYHAFHITSDGIQLPVSGEVSPTLIQSTTAT